MRETAPLVKPLSAPSSSSSLFHTQQISVHLKLVLLLLSLSATFFLLSSCWIGYSSSPFRVQTPFVSNSRDNGPSSSSSSSSIPKEVPPNEPIPKCDLFKGDWVPNLNSPPTTYNNNTCRFIEPTQNCMKNGRPDAGYLFWRWKPRDCELPNFDPKRFLNFMTNKKFAFIGDSIPRNQAQSLLCILSQVEEPEENFIKHQGTWVFPSYNFTLVGIWAPYLIKADIVEDQNGDSTPNDIKLHLNVVDDIWTKQYNELDFVVLGVGPWFTRTTIFYENNKVQGCNNCPGRNLTNLGHGYAYRKAINRAFDFITQSSHKPQVMFNTIAPSHFEFGKWNDGGNCNRKEPFTKGEGSLSEGDRIMYDVSVQEFYESTVNDNGKYLKLMDITLLSLLRPDGHPGAYRQYYPFALDDNTIVQNDCLHWCLPGPIDTWNQLMFELLITG